jgi:hydantoinase/carbamoylase family amidase
VADRPVIAAEDLAVRLAGLDRIGARADGLWRLAWTEADARTGAWFDAQATAAGLRPERDAAGNRWALPAGAGPWWGIGSHLDSVRGGGAFDGPLGVAAAFEVAAHARADVAVVSFADEEGARFNTPTFGSRALTGRLDLEVLGRADEVGVTLGEAMAAAGIDPAGLAEAGTALGRLRGFLELHIDQTRDLERAGRPAGVVTGLAARMRVQAELTGRADHAGTTRREDRRDAMAAAARLIVAADDLALPTPGFVVTAGRLEVEPNAATTIPARVGVWLDARAPDPAPLAAWRDALDAEAAALAERTRVAIEVRTASSSDGVAFDPAVRAALHAAAERVGAPAPDLLCFAGHDAGILAERLPAGMVFVRNPTGVSHSPDERVSLADAAVAASVLLEAVEAL